MSKLIQIQCKDLEPRNIIRSGNEGHVVKEIEVVGRHLEISLMGANEIIKASPNQKIWVQKEDDFFDFDDRPSELKGWSEDGSYMTASGISYTADEMFLAAYSGCEGGL